MFARLAARFSQRISVPTYEGARAAFIPMDAAASFLAKRHRAAYWLWRAYTSATDPLFEPRLPDAETSAGDAAFVGTLKERGYAVVPSAYHENEVRGGREWVTAHYEHSLEKRALLDPSRQREHLVWEQDGITTEHFRRTGRTRLHFTESVLARGDCPLIFRRFAEEDGAWRAVAARYFGTAAVRGKLPYLMSEVLEPAPGIEPWHIDCIRPTLKAFLHLGDVTLENGPLRYIPSSHVVDAAREELFFRICESGLGKAYFDEAENARLDAKATAVEAPANTLVFFDNRGLHASSFCKRGIRVVVVNGYRPVGATRVNPRMFRDPRPVPMPWEA